MLEPSRLYIDSLTKSWTSVPSFPTSSQKVTSLNPHYMQNSDPCRRKSMPQISSALKSISWVLQSKKKSHSQKWNTLPKQRPVISRRLAPRILHVQGIETRIRWNRHTAHIWKRCSNGSNHDEPSRAGILWGIVLPSFWEQVIVYWSKLGEILKDTERRKKAPRKLPNNTLCQYINHKSWVDEYLEWEVAKWKVDRWAWVELGKSSKVISLSSIANRSHQPNTGSSQNNN